MSEFSAEATAPTPNAARYAELGRAKHVIESHLLRFAFREDIQALAWSGPETSAPPPRPELRPT